MSHNLRFLILFSFFLSACSGPTFHKERLAESVVELCKKEYKLPVEAKFVGSTLGVLVRFPEGLFDPSLKPTEQAMDKVWDVLMAAARVATSSDAKVDFLIITAREERPAGFEWVLTRNVMDIKRQLLGDISRNEAMKRMEMDFNLRLFEKPQEAFTVREILMPDFIGRQLGRRIKDHFDREAALAERFDLESVEGRLEPEGSQKGKIILFYQVHRKDGLALSGSDEEEVTRPMALEVQSVVRYYNYGSFGAVHFQNGATQSERIVDRPSLKKFAHKKFDLFSE